MRDERENVHMSSLPGEDVDVAGIAGLGRSIELASTGSWLRITDHLHVQHTLYSWDSS